MLSPGLFGEFTAGRVVADEPSPMAKNQKSRKDLPMSKINKGGWTSEQHLQYVENIETATGEYVRLSGEISTARGSLLTALATFYSDLMSLAQLESDLQANYAIIAPDANTNGDIANAINAYVALVRFPISKIFSCIDSIMSAVNTRNALGIDRRVRYLGTLLTSLPMVGTVPDVFQRDDRFTDLAGISSVVENPEAALTNYTTLSGQIATARAGLISSLSTFHEDLCTLAGLERDLEAERATIAPDDNDVNTPNILEAMQQHSRFVNLPVLEVWSNVDSAMQIIAAHNGEGVSPAAGDVPALFRRTNRIMDFTGQS